MVSEDPGNGCLYHSIKLQDPVSTSPQRGTLVSMLVNCTLQLFPAFLKLRSSEQEQTLGYDLAGIKGNRKQEAGRFAV